MREDAYIMKNFKFPHKFSGVPVIGGAFTKSQTELIPLSYGYPHPDTFSIEELIKASENALSIDGRNALQYTGGKGKANLINWIKKRVEHIKINVTDENILVTSGANQAIDLVTRSLTNPGDSIWVESPSFFGALRYFYLAEANIQAFPLDKNGVLVDEIEDELRKVKESKSAIPKIIYVIPNHHNPEGVSLSIERRQKLAELAREYNFFIIEDDAYGELTFDGDKPPSIYSFCPDRVIYIGSFSKVFGPGLRLGWTIANKNTLNKIRTLKSDGSTSVFVQEIIYRMLEEFDFDDHINYLKHFYKRRKDLMVNAIREYFSTDVTFNVPKGGFFIWLTFPEHVDTKNILQQAITKYSVDFFASEQFYIHEKEHNHIRLSFTYCEENQISESISYIAKAYSDLYA